MTEPAPQSKRTWLLAALAAVAGMGLVLALFRGPTFPAPKPPGSKPALEWPVAGTAQPTEDKALFKDPTPLFLPTRWNSVPPTRERREPQGNFAGYGPDYTFSNNDLQLDLPAAVRVPSRPAEALVNDAPGNPFLGIGRADVAVPPLSRRWAFVEILAAAGGRRVFARALTDPAQAPPPLRDGNWRPLELMAAVDAAGLVGQLTPVVRPNTLLDDRFHPLPGDSLVLLEDYLADVLRLGNRLPPGFYRVLVGP